MPFPHAVLTSEIGMIRIYVKPGDKGREGSLKRFFNAKPLYRALVQTAKADGILNATAHQTHYGYSNYGKLQAEDVEISNPNLTMCVELIAGRDELEAFCRSHSELLGSKVIIYIQLEQWSLKAAGV